MPLDADAVRRGCRGAEVSTARQLCRAELERFRAAAAGGEPLIVGCTQEAPLFSEVAAEGERRTLDLRQCARDRRLVERGRGRPARRWRRCSRPPPSRRPTFPSSVCRSEGVTLIYGRDERAIEAGEAAQRPSRRHRADQPPDGHRAAARRPIFRWCKGTIRSAKGHLGAFELDGRRLCRARAVVARRADIRRGAQTARCRAATSCSISPAARRCFPAHDLRDGYLRADPGDPAAVLRAVLKARDLVGSFDKPRYITFTEDLCAHSRSQIVGCHRCLDLCPTGAITPAGDHVAIDANICAGCGQCAAVCPTGAAAYALPPADALMRKLRALLTAYREAGGDAAGRAAA